MLKPNTSISLMRDSHLHTFNFSQSPSTNPHLTPA
jgi:hypothetical protein